MNAGLEFVIVPHSRRFIAHAGFCLLCGAYTNETLTYTLDGEQCTVHLCARHPIAEATHQLYGCHIVLRRHRSE